MWDTVANLKTIIGLAAFALAVVSGVMLAYFKSKRRKIPLGFWVVVVLLLLLGDGATLYKTDDLYRVRVIVLNTEKVP